ncbi:guanine nucleotide exchange factor MSS4 isoform X1 [Acanthopagrus latus]|uniref:guanine nucleotide exchange factor MSS4 isoform X1 n=2 Tax=Acanthopagrus latus TaxID=8177 RepID=UPI00187CC290|nr:guanine nucleotide exchange factor MSS4 isoform X1 [Acanthopagrus latus]
MVRRKYCYNLYLIDDKNVNIIEFLCHGLPHYKGSDGLEMENNQLSKESTNRSDLVSDDGKNSKSVVCQRCGSKVLCPGMAVFAEKELFLPSMRKKSGLSSTEGSVDGDTLTAHWFVDDMYTFENVGFTKDVGNIKYLICADCEIGPIGWHCLDDKKSFYVAVERVNHA